MWAAIIVGALSGGLAGSWVAHWLRARRWSTSSVVALSTVHGFVVGWIVCFVASR